MSKTLIPTLLYASLVLAAIFAIIYSIQTLVSISTSGFTNENIFHATYITVMLTFGTLAEYLRFKKNKKK